jgi:outer membrane protein OmpA-like peptidoglycan-associated protein
VVRSIGKSKYICRVIKYLMMNLSRWLVLFFLLFSSPAVFAAGRDQGIRSGHHPIQLNQKDTVVIRFDYKQSALYHSFTFEVLDSVISILLKNKAVTLSIEGYAYKDEGSDTICYYLSLNRALFIHTYILGRGVDSSRIISVKGYGRRKAMSKKTDKDGFLINCRAEILLTYPPPPQKAVIHDRDEDGIVDSEDRCPDVFGYKDNSGCPDSDFVVVPFEVRQSDLYTTAYKVLDSVLAMLSENPSITIAIQGHAYSTEGIYSVCDRLAAERAEIVKQYLLSRNFSMSRIRSVKGYSYQRPLNAGKTPKEITANSRAEILFTRK